MTTERTLPVSAWRRRLLLGAWLAAAAVLCVRAAQIQVLQAGQWKSVAEEQHTTDRVIAAARGPILDRDGVPLAVSREVYRVSVAPRELEDRESVAARLRSVLGVSRSRARAVTDPRRRWAVIPGTFPPAVRDSLAGLRGVYLERELQRYHPHGDLARGVLGVVIDGEGRGGIEQVLDTLLRGRPGRAVVARDNVGRAIPGETYVVDQPMTGGEVVLTLDTDLQEIARQALREAVEKAEARGGDVLVTDPRTGEILALVSMRDGRTASLSAINTPYEPGSTLKPFTVAALLSNRLAALSDTIDVEDGTWRVAGRTLHDVHAEGRMSIADALRVSSNVGIAKAAQVLTPGQQYENLRDFGFGAPTGIEIPGEAAGILRRPDRWSGQSPASLAIGYEVSVTPLQMAMAYGALANGGRLMQPRILREVRDRSGRVLQRFEPRMVRRVIDARVARTISRVLEDVVEDGTGTAARLGTFRVAGKSGTSRAYAAGGGYERGNYYASFVGFFPAEDPQLVVVVKLERPRGRSYYGGSVAAPVTRATMEAALAARTTPLDRTRLLGTVRGPVVLTAPAPVRFAAQPIDPPAPPLGHGSPAQGAAGEVMDAGGVPVPDVVGLPVRIAARRLHHRGFRVALRGSGRVTAMHPGPGAAALPGDTIRLVLRGRPRG